LLPVWIPAWPKWIEIHSERESGRRVVRRGERNEGETARDEKKRQREYRTEYHIAKKALKHLKVLYSVVMKGGGSIHQKRRFQGIQCDST
jgi:hypothetical protein